MGGGRNPLLPLRKAKQFRFFGLFFLLIDSKAPQCQTKGKVEESVFFPSTVIASEQSDVAIHSYGGQEAKPPIVMHR